MEKRSPKCCIQRWSKINEGCCKFVGSYVASTKEKTSGQNDNYVVNLAHQIFYTDYKTKFSLEYAWREVRFDQKLCSCNDLNVPAKRRKQNESAGDHVTIDLEGDQISPIGVRQPKPKPKVKPKRSLLWKVMQTTL
ncbi:putative glutathione transferase [Arabidopsis thaliana]